MLSTLSFLRVVSVSYLFIFLVLRRVPEYIVDAQLIFAGFHNGLAQSEKGREEGKQEERDQYKRLLGLGTWETRW